MLNPKFKDISPYFKVQEFVPKEIYEKYGETSIRFIHPSIVSIANLVRSRMGVPITINGSGFDESGFRVPETKTGARLSSHKRGCAIDVRGKFEPRKIYDDILANYAEYRAVGLTTVEDIDMTPTWVHLSCEWTGKNELTIVKP